MMTNSILEETELLALSFSYFMKVMCHWEMPPALSVTLSSVNCVALNGRDPVKGSYSESTEQCQL